MARNQSQASPREASVDAQRTFNIHWAEVAWNEPFLAVSVPGIRRAHRRLLVRQGLVVAAVVLASQVLAASVFKRHEPIVVLVTDAEVLAPRAEPVREPVAQPVMMKPTRPVAIVPRPVRTVTAPIERPAGVAAPDATHGIFASVLAEDPPVKESSNKRKPARAPKAEGSEPPAPPVASGPSKETVIAPADKLGIQSLHRGDVEMQGGQRFKVGSTFPGGEVVMRIDPVKGVVETDRRILVVGPQVVPETTQP